MVAPFYSIIIPTYNSAKTIEAAIESVLSQKFIDFEILIIDGSSTDDTILKVEEFGDSRIRIVSEKDNGVYDAMNKGIQLSKGEWLYFLGSDDILTDSKVFENVYKQIIKTTSGVLYGNVVIKGNTNWATDGTLYDGVFSLSKLLLKNICHQAIFYKKELIAKEQIAFNLNYPVCADWDFNLRLWVKQPFKYMPLTISFFYAGGISTQNSAHDDFIENVVLKMIEYSGIKSYQKLKKIIPEEMYYQLKLIDRYKWQIKLEKFKQIFSGK